MHPTACVSDPDLSPACRVRGQPLTRLPEDLYIPPDALEVFLESFEGPLDLLLYLIRKQNLDILEIPIAEVTRQYMAYIEVMQALRLELAGEYLVMAALLAEIKSRLLLPQSPSADVDEEDPRLALIRQLQEYERFKQAAERLDALPRQDRDFFHAQTQRGGVAPPLPLAPPTLPVLLNALVEVLHRLQLHSHHTVPAEVLSVRRQMARILECLEHGQYSEFVTLLVQEEGRLGVVVVFLALLELSKAGIIEWGQTEAFGTIQVRRRQPEMAAE
jgi:segregation and condensation protein A